MVKQDFDSAAKHLKHYNDLGSAMTEAECVNNTIRDDGARI